jgi:hypothetical protein
MDLIPIYAQLIACVLLFIALTVLLWRIRKALDSLPNVVRTLIIQELSSRYAKVPAEFTDNLKVQVAELTQAISALKELQQKGVCPDVQSVISRPPACQPLAGQDGADRWAKKMAMTDDAAKAVLPACPPSHEDGTPSVVI